MQQTIIYNGSEVVVSKEIAEFLERDHKRENADGRSDRRHKDITDLETAEQLTHNNVFVDPVLNDLLQKETFEQIRNVIASLDDSRRLIELHYYEECSLTATAEFFGITKQALSKRHTKLLKKMRELMET